MTSILLTAGALAVAAGVFVWMSFGNRKKKQRVSDHVYMNKGDVVCDKYELIEYLNSGATCQVWKARALASHADPRFVAIKVIPKSALKVRQHLWIKNEVNTLLRLREHMTRDDHISNLFEYSETDDYYQLVMELCEGGELLARLNDIGRALPEPRAREITRQLIHAAMFMHSHGIIHRDLKPENIVLTTRDDDSPIKVIDFGLAKLFSADKMSSRDIGSNAVTANTVVGSAGYQAPEILVGGGYSFTVDYWSIGAVLYVMLTCELLPDEAVHGSLSENKIEQMLGRESCEDVSEEAKDIIRHLLDPDPKRRLSGFGQASASHDPIALAVGLGKHILEQPWFHEGEGASKRLERQRGGLKCHEAKGVEISRTNDVTFLQERTYQDDDTRIGTIDGFESADEGA